MNVDVEFRKVRALLYFFIQVTHDILKSEVVCKSSGKESANCAGSFSLGTPRIELLRDRQYLFSCYPMFASSWALLVES